MSRRAMSAPAFQDGGDSVVSIRQIDRDRGIREYTFSSRSRVGVKREVLSYWHRHRDVLGLTLKDFLARCRISNDETTVIFK